MLPSYETSSSRYPFQSYIFLYFSFILSNTLNLFPINIIYKLIELLQLLSFSFNDLFAKLCKGDSLYSYIKNFLYYFTLTQLYTGKIALYSIVVFIVIFVIYAYIGISVWFTYSLSKGEKKRHHIGVMISFFFPIFTNIFFLPFINVLFSIFNCTKGKHYYIKDYSCSGTYYYTIKRSMIYSNINN